MLSRTHLTVGTAASLAASFFILQPESLSDVLIAFAGGAVGGVFADVDTVSHDRKHDVYGWYAGSRQRSPKRQRGSKRGDHHDGVDHVF